MNQNTYGVSIIIPTLREAKNISELVDRIAKIDFGSRKMELILVDDNSQDGIKEVVNTLQPTHPWLRLIVRTNNKGLSASVIEGFEAATFPILILMDADLSHPPEKIILMLSALEDIHVDFVIGSRYVNGGSTAVKWPLYRKLLSQCSAKIASMLLPVSVTDPLSGFFAVRKSKIRSGDMLDPVGWKIGLEIMIKCNCQTIREVPIHFSERFDGKSKLTIFVILSYFKHLTRLISYKLLC